MYSINNRIIIIFFFSSDSVLPPLHLDSISFSPHPREYFLSNVHLDCALRYLPTSFFLSVFMVIHIVYCFHHWNYLKLNLAQLWKCYWWATLHYHTGVQYIVFPSYFPLSLSFSLYVFQCMYLSLYISLYHPTTSLSISLSLPRLSHPCKSNRCVHMQHYHVHTRIVN